MGWISYRGGRRRMVPSAPGRAPRATLPDAGSLCALAVSAPMGAPARPFSCRTVADRLISAEDKLRTAVPDMQAGSLQTLE